MKKALSLVLALIMAFSAVSIMAYAADNGTEYTIVNPYKDVDWDTYTTYLANLHTHTTASDGDVTLTDMVQAYYDKGYDILCITDHGVINEGWTKERTTYPLFNKFRTVTPMSEEDYERFTTGSDRNGRGIIDIPGGIETNMATISKVHVNGYFTTWGNGVWGTENDYKTATVEIEKSGGYSVLNHVGDWVNNNNFPERSYDDNYIGYLADIFTTSKTCLGMEICNSTDNCTRADKALWDSVLQVVIPTGRNVWAFSDDDSEQLDEVGRSFELFPLAENTVENVKEAMISGAFFSASRYIKTMSREDEFEGNGLVPIVSNIKIDGDKITVETDPSRDCTGIEWIADGKVISTDYTLDISDHADEIGCYVRFQLRGEGGITYSQAFEVQYDGRVDKEIPDSIFTSDNIVIKVLRALYKTHIYALNALIVEKIADYLGIIPKTLES